MRWRRFIIWITERDNDVSTTTPVTSTRVMTLSEIDVVLRHWSAKLPNARDAKQRQQWMNLIDRWLDARHRISLTHQLEQHIRK